MPTSIVRIYQTHSEADVAAADLKRHGFTTEQVAVVPAGQDAASGIAAAGVSHNLAPRYAEALGEEGAAVIVHPPFGEAAFAEDVLAKYKSVDAGLAPSVSRTPETLDDAAPLSRWLGWRVLLDDPTPLSRRLGWRVLTEKPYTLGNPPLTDNPAPLSRALGLPTLTKSHGPVTNTSGVASLADKPSPFSDRLGWKTLTQKQLALGDIKLSQEPAPFSKLLGLPVLTRNQ